MARLAGRGRPPAAVQAASRPPVASRARRPARRARLRLLGRGGEVAHRPEPAVRPRLLRGRTPRRTRPLGQAARRCPRLPGHGGRHRRGGADHSGCRGGGCPRVGLAASLPRLVDQRPRLRRRGARRQGARGAVHPRCRVPLPAPKARCSWIRRRAEVDHALRRMAARTIAGQPAGISARGAAARYPCMRGTPGTVQRSTEFSVFTPSQNCIPGSCGDASGLGTGG
mmetsp:Transcript_18887/g.60325  ORF Transcript_18887/g.60325 Transcript_18887/m.60325 type:complete len:226 (+) Transcript_18887:103-780(+)